MYSIQFTPTAMKAIAYLRTSEPRIAEKVAHTINRLATEPHRGVPLRGELKGYWKLRVGSYRIIYQILQRRLVVIVIDIGHRKDVYR